MMNTDTGRPLDSFTEFMAGAPPELQYLAEMPVFIVIPELLSFVQHWAKAHGFSFDGDDGDTILSITDPLPITAQPPMDRFAIFQEGTSTLTPRMLLVEAHKQVGDGSKEIDIYAVSRTRGSVLHCGHFVPGRTVPVEWHIRTSEILHETTTFSVPATELLKSTMSVAFVLAIINTPSIVRSTPAPRAARRRLSKLNPAARTEQIRVITWNMDKPKLAAGESVGSGRHMPLHYTRGHWRKCEAHHNGAITHDDGVVRQWIEGFWSGHPAYGTIKSVYVPRTGVE